MNEAIIEMYQMDFGRMSDTASKKNHLGTKRQALTTDWQEISVGTDCKFVVVTNLSVSFLFAAFTNDGDPVVITPSGQRIIKVSGSIFMRLDSET